MYAANPSIDNLSFYRHAKVSAISTASISFTETLSPTTFFWMPRVTSKSVRTSNPGSI